MAKGFRTGQGPQRTAHINFAAGHELHGLEIEIGLRVPVGVLLAADRDVLGEGVKAFATRVVYWNLEDENGVAEKITEAAMRRQFDIIEAAELVKAWIEQVTQPAAPLAPASNDTSSLAAGSAKAAPKPRSRPR
jgi:hypothetical protein